MIYFLYDKAIFLLGYLLRPIALFNPKIKLFLKGRKETFARLKVIAEKDKVLWIHCASLGEFEQGRPVIEAIKQKYTGHKIALTFFSPSGYEIRKDYQHADIVCYLPLDTKKNAKKFIQTIHPELAIFVKYEFWPNTLRQLKEHKIKTLLVSAIFRKEQVFFKKSITSHFMKTSLSAFNHFFVQDNASRELLQSIGFDNVSVSGDTRFDSVQKIADQKAKIPAVEKFIQKTTDFVLAAGSTWKKDEALLVNFINASSSNQQFIIAPHAINDLEIEKLRRAIIKETILYSEIVNTEKTLSQQNAQVLLVDTIGILNKIYRYADVAYIGGGFGTGIHNILEPATYGLPIVIGPNFTKFKEARDLVEKQGCFVVSNQEELTSCLHSFKDKKHLNKTGKISKQYVLDSIGATPKILGYIENVLTQ